MRARSIARMFVLVLLCVVGGSAARAYPKTITVQDGNNGTLIRLHIGDTLIVRLTSNASTGFSWQISQNDSTLLRPVGASTYERSTTGRIGAPGVQVFRFRAVRPGGTQLALVYKRPVSSDPSIQPIKQYQVMVVINRQSSGRNIVLTNQDNGSQVNVPQGDTVTVRLPSNPSTGYSWSVIQNFPQILQPLGTPHFVHSNSGLMGAPGQQEFRFKAVMPGTFFLQLFYQRPWNRGGGFTQQWGAFVTVTPAWLLPGSDPFIGTYVQTLPAADASALRITLQLNADKTCTLTQDYVGKSKFVDKGVWSENGNQVTVILTQPNATRIVFTRNQGTLVATDYDYNLYGSIGMQLKKQ